MINAYEKKLAKEAGDVSLKKTTNSHDVAVDDDLTDFFDDFDEDGLVVSVEESPPPLQRKSVHFAEPPTKQLQSSNKESMVCSKVTLVKRTYKENVKAAKKKSMDEIVRNDSLDEEIVLDDGSEGAA